ncbi:MAG TPA: packaged DNA stabilization protein, partial [Phycisphaerae bacterium]|nr:packaged DNA stabilization protein [Phycisphaerae bacterium]
MARSVNAADSRMVNLFPEMVPDGGKEPAFLQRAPGLRLVGAVGDGPIRGMWRFGDFLYVASGGKLYRVDANFAATELGLINGSGPVSMSDNGVQLFVACNPDAFIYNASTGAFAQVTDPDFPGAVTVGYLDGYFVFNEPNSQRFWVTSLNDGASVDPLDFASAEANPDDVVSLMVSHREVWLFGNNSIEVWYNAGLADFPLARIQGAVLEFGCQAPYSVAKMDNSLFWLGADARGSGVVYRSNGYNAQRISTHAVEWQIQQYAVTNDALAYTYQQDGHSFYVLIFPTAQATWVFDVSTGAWHERAYWDGVEFRRHRSNCQANFAGRIVVGDWEGNELYAFDLTTYADNGETQRWLRSWRALPMGQNTLKRTAQHSLQLDCESGVGAATVDSYFILTENNLFLTTESDDLLLTNDISPDVGSNPQV